MRVRARVVVIVAVSAAVAGMVTAAGLVWWRWDTGRQPKVMADIPFMDQAIADTLVAAGTDAAVATSGIYRAKTCKLGALREGGEYTRKADLYTDPGREDDLITRIERGLPAAYQARREPARDGDAAPLAASTGKVTLSVRQLGDGWLVATARTGCTTGSDPAVPSAPPDTAITTITSLLAQLGTKPAETLRHVLACPSGQLVTVSVLSSPTDATDLKTRLQNQIPAATRRFDSPANRVAWREGNMSIIIGASDDNTAITARYTSGCG